ncbi:uncharacterized protein BX663DRAFT_515342 [Cokeromyces recurvatus]|uniref:uncharacterized protein n=1 Tax=Cokeromyces recurvatus TaxID=90255 RepID=UPI0022203AA5|nr:uncharacterized protein BX663DRAFT_515342 [Cokeromyces recurvatus]KAI7901234.1 hypothetical protein BX663DRAFT_515342 [Cokeromyces recurvatus]
MTRSKDSLFSYRHDKHVARNSQHGMKKMGAGAANWGILGDELPDVQEIVRAEIDSSSSFLPNHTSTKLNLVDFETFEHMRSSSTVTDTEQTST